MTYLYTVRLEKMEFYAYHGVHTGEKELGNRFQTDIAITFKTEYPVKELSQTVDYAQVATTIAQVMTGINTDLLEVLAHQIIEKIYSQISYLTVQKISIKISKYNPPIKQICAASSVELEKYY